MENRITIPDIKYTHRNCIEFLKYFPPYVNINNIARLLLSSEYKDVYEISNTMTTQIHSTKGETYDTDQLPVHLKHLKEYFIKGCPDFLCFDYNNNYKFIEIKRITDELRLSQFLWFAKFNKINAEVMILDYGK